MFETSFSKKELFLVTLFSLFILTLIFFVNNSDSKNTIVFCDVGQGDGAYIRIDNSIDIVVDAGPNREILNCLGKYMPFYDRSIELGIISHGQKDHFGGFIYILDRYDVKKIWMSEVINNSDSLKALLDKIRAKDVSYEFPKKGETSTFASAQIEFFWPSDSFILNNTSVENSLYKNFRRSLRDLNDFSLIFTLQLPETNILFTGDASSLILSGLSRESKIKTDILKMPHHGSKNGLILDFLNLADPTYAVISSGKNNSYGHPHKVILDMLKTRGVIIRRTDKEGNIVFKF